MISILTHVVFGVMLLLTGLSVGESSDPPSNYDEKLTLGVEAFYHTDWEQAKAVFSELKQESPSDPLPHFFSSMMPFWEYFFVDSSPELADDFLNQSEKAITLSRNKLDNAPGDTTMVLMLSGLYGYRSLVAAGENRYRVALQSGLTGFNYTRQLLRINSDRADARIGRGMFYYMVGSIPREMRWAANMTGLSGDVEEGFEELKKAAESDSYVSTDARMMLVYLYQREERYDEALVYADELIGEYPENVIFLFKKGELSEAVGNKAEAVSLYSKVVELDNPTLHKITQQSRSRIDRLNEIGFKD